MTSRKRQRTENGADMSAVDATSDHPPDGSRKDEGATARPFACEFAGCGKVYSRSEHLQRHQLNHAPKEIFRCDVQGCHRSFVRQDLCNRHRERHAQPLSQDAEEIDFVRESTLARTDSNQGVRDNTQGTHSVRKRRVGRPSLADMHRPSSTRLVTDQVGSESDEVNQQPVRSEENVVQGGRSAGDIPQHTPRANVVDHTSNTVQSAILDNNNWDQQDSANFSHISFQYQETNPPLQNHHAELSDSRVRRASATFGFNTDIWSQDGGNGAPSIQPNHFPPAVATTDNMTTSAAFNHQPQSFPTTHAAQPGAISAVPRASQTMGSYEGNLVLQEQVFTESPSSVRDEFTNWLFDGYQEVYSGFGQLGERTDYGLQSTSNFSTLPSALGYSADPFYDGNYASLAQGPLMADASCSPSNSTTTRTWLSAYKRHELIEFMRSQFDQGVGDTGQSQKETIFYGDHDLDGHVLSTRLMQQYIQSYWHHFHDQMPILHRPTFSADNSPNLLVLAVMTIGASLLTKDHGREVTDAAQRFANFVAWNLRWRVFMDSGFQPPATLWIFQTLILLEVYEKMNATRALHERANVHYATLINLMRRGTALVEDASRPSAMQGRLATPNEWWERWVTAEATRRAAFAAFLLDATHANIFGHTAVMVVHEIHLPLPCDQALWSATSPGEVARVEASFHLNGIKPMTFLQALKRTLTGRKVRTNAFGRMIVMAGLLSVSWHLRQKELQMSTLGGVLQATGVPETWRATLVKSFDFWKKDFDAELMHMRSAPFGWQDSAARFETKLIADNATVMHHLSHIAMYVDVTDCQILAGVRNLLGRSITDATRERVARKMCKWRMSDGAKQAVHHSIQLLQESIRLNPSDQNTEHYDARDDCLLTRPWALYFAALVVWCYNFSAQALPERISSRTRSPSRMSESAPASPAQNHSDLLQHRAAGRDTTRPSSPSPGPSIATKRPEVGRSELDDNKLAVLLSELEASFRESRWELLHEAASRLQEARQALRRDLVT